MYIAPFFGLTFINERSSSSNPILTHFIQLIGK